MDTIISSLISGFVAIVVCVFTQILQNSKTRALLEYRLMELEKKQDKHNDVIERTYKLEEASALHEEKIKVANHRIDDLEKRI
jgi:cell division protein FtsL